MNVYEIIEKSNGEDYNIRVNQKLNVEKKIDNKKTIYQISSKNNGKTNIITITLDNSYSPKSKTVFALKVDITKVINSGDVYNINNLVYTQERLQSVFNTVSTEDIFPLESCNSENVISFIMKFLKDNNVLNNNHLNEGLHYLISDISNSLNDLFVYMVDTTTNYIEFLEKKKNDFNSNNLKFAFSSYICDIYDEIDYLKEYYRLNEDVLKR